MSANDQTAWEPEGPVGGFEMNIIETKYIKQDRWGREWLMLNCDSGAAVTALPIAVAGDLPLEKRGEFRVASGQSLPIWAKSKCSRRMRGNRENTSRKHHGSCETAAECCGGLQKMGLSSLRRWRNLVGTKRSCCFGNSISFGQAQSLESSCQEHQTLPRRQLVQCVCASWRCHARAGTGRALFKLDQEKLTMDNVTSRMNLRISLRSSGECWPLVSPQNWRAETFSNESCCFRTLARGVCENERNRSTASETDEQGIGKARTVRTQNLLRFLLHV